MTDDPRPGIRPDVVASAAGDVSSRHLAGTGGAALVIAGALAATLRPASEMTASLFGRAATLLSLDPRAFWIWWAVIAGLSVFIVWLWTARGRASRRGRAIGWPAAVAGVAHLGWVLSAQTGLLVPAIVLLALTVGSLCLVVWRLAKYRASWLEHLATDPGWGLALGFVTVEALVSVPVIVESYSLVESDLYLITAIIACCVFVAGALAMAGRLYRQYAVGLGLAWGLGWVGWERVFGEPRSYLLAGLAAFGCFVILAAFYASARRRRSLVPGLEGGHPWT